MVEVRGMRNLGPFPLQIYLMHSRVSEPGRLIRRVQKCGRAEIEMKKITKSAALKGP